jgi:hypothetical protein
MWKFLIAIAAVVRLAMFGNASLAIPHIPYALMPYALMSLPAIVIIFAARMYLSQR